MKELVLSRQFKHDLKLCQRRGYDIDRLSAVLVQLQSGAALPRKIGIIRLSETGFPNANAILGQIGS